MNGELIVFICVVGAFLFFGDPDLQDALIYYLCDGNIEELKIFTAELYQVEAYNDQP